MAIIPACWQSYCIPTGELNGHDKHELSVYLWSMNDYNCLKCLPVGIKVQEGNKGWTSTERVRHLCMMIFSRLNKAEKNPEKQHTKKRKQPVLRLKLQLFIMKSKKQMMQCFSKNRRQESGIWKLIKYRGKIKEENKTSTQGNFLEGRRKRKVIATNWAAELVGILNRIISEHEIGPWKTM